MFERQPMPQSYSLRPLWGKKWFLDRKQDHTLLSMFSTTIERIKCFLVFPIKHFWQHGVCLLRLHFQVSLRWWPVSDNFATWFTQTRPMLLSLNRTYLLPVQPGQLLLDTHVWAVQRQTKHVSDVLRGWIFLMGCVRSN